MSDNKNTISLLYQLKYSRGDKYKELIKEFNNNEKISNFLNDIFKHGYIGFMNEYINEFRDIFKDYVFNPIQQLYMTISKNTGMKKVYWDNSWMNEKLKEIGYDISKELTTKEWEDIILAYDLSARSANYDIYMPSNVVIDDYSINLLWINLNPQSEKLGTLSRYIFDDSIKDKFLDSISKWRKLNPNITINLWCDSGLINKESFENTVELLKKYNVNFMDIRVIPDIPPFVLKTLHPIIPVYYRVDLSKILLTDYLTNPKYNKNRYIVYADIDVEPMGADKLFDYITLDNLEKYGYVFNIVDSVPFENSFFIFDSKNKSAIINRNIVENLEKDFRDIYEGKKNNRFYSSTTIYDEYYPPVLEEKGERTKEDKRRKPVKSPVSQFLFGIDLDYKDHRNEVFSLYYHRSPQTKYGRELTFSELEYIALYKYNPVPLT